MSPIRSIVAGTDLSADSLEAVDRGYLVAEAVGARYTVLHALGLDPVLSLRQLLGEDAEALSERVARAAEQRLQAITSDATRNRGVIAEAVVNPGQPATALFDFVQEHDTDLLILGARGAGAVRRALFGSTASRALRKSPVPVLIVRNQAREGYRRILVAVDFSPASQALVEMSLAIAPHAQLRLLHVCSDALEAQLRYADVTEPVISEYRANAERRATRQLSELVDACGLAPDQHSQHVVHGSPAWELIRHAKEYDPDLIVLGKHGTHVVDELLLGSVTKRALDRALADVLVMVDRRRANLV